MTARTQESPLRYRNICFKGIFQADHALYTPGLDENRVSREIVLHKLNPDRCVQSVVSLKKSSVGLSCGFTLGAGFLLHLERETADDRPTNRHYSYHLFFNEHFSIIHNFKSIRHCAVSFLHFIELSMPSADSHFQKRSRSLEHT